MSPKWENPYKAWHKSKPNVSHLQEFRSDVWVLDESKDRSKLDPKSKKMTPVGFMDGSKSIQYYDAKTCSIKVSRNVAFNENDEPKELEDFVKIPGLQAEEENFKGPTLQTEPEILWIIRCFPIEYNSSSQFLIVRNPRMSLWL